MSTVEQSSKSPVAAGCFVSRTDTPLIIASIACFGAFAVYGACVAALGASLPSLAEETNRSKSAFGIAFTTRGIGYLVGTLASAWVLSIKNLPVSKQFMTCFALSITGVATAIIAYLTSFPAILSLFFFQGIGFGGIDVMANCVMPELWGLRVQPWMQALHSCFGVGAIIGPALVGSIGYKASYIVIALFSFVPLAGLFAVYLYGLRSGSDPSLETSSTSSNNTSDSEAISTTDQGIPCNDIPVPLMMKLLITGFYFVYVGVESGYAGWIPSFALDEHVTHSNSQAAYLSSYFWGALTGGRLLAIVVAVYASATSMLRFQLVAALVAAILIVILANTSYTNAAGVSAFYGFALSAIFPLAMTIVSDYGYTMDSATTTLFMVASTCGEAIIPVCMGLVISEAGAMSLTYVTIAATCILCGIYLGMHQIGGRKNSNYNGNNKGNNSSGETIERQTEDGIEMETSSFAAAMHTITNNSNTNTSTTHKNNSNNSENFQLELQQCV